MRQTAFSTVNWRKYLDVNTNPRAKAFLDSRGDDVLWQLANNVHKAAVNKGLSQLVLLVHPNAGAVIKIEKNDFKEVLTLALKWFENKENYKRCSRIQLFINNIDKLKRGIKVDKNINEIVI
jgi:hypothetical protein